MISTERDLIFFTTESKILYQILFNLKLMITDELFFFNYFFFSLINITFLILVLKSYFEKLQLKFESF